MLSLSSLTMSLKKVSLLYEIDHGETLKEIPAQLTEYNS